MSRLLVTLDDARLAAHKLRGGLAPADHLSAVCRHLAEDCGGTSAAAVRRELEEATGLSGAALRDAVLEAPRALEGRERGKRLRALRERHGLSGEALGCLLQLDTRHPETTIWRWERRAPGCPPWALRLAQLELGEASPLPSYGGGRVSSDP